MAKENIANTLMQEDAKIWRESGIKSGHDIYPYYGHVGINVWNKYQKTVQTMLNKHGFSKKNKVDWQTREEIEDKNYHSLNQAIDFLGYGVGKKGLSKKEFFKTPKSSVKKGNIKKGKSVTKKAGTKTYTKTHKLKKAADGHARLIKKRGGKVTQTGNKLTYSF